MKIGQLFQRDITRRINPVVKVEDQDPAEVRGELEEYVITEQIGRNFARLIEQHYLEKNTEDTAIWISGFFGSGKSLFLKLLCLLFSQAPIAGLSVIDQLSAATDDGDVKRALQALKTRKPAFVISTHMESEAFTGATIVEILWRRLHQACGYSRTPWVAEIERSLEKQGLLKAFVSTIEQEGRGAWAALRDDPLLRRPLLAKALRQVDATTYPDVEAAERAILEVQKGITAEQTSAGFTRRCLELLSERGQYDRMFWGLDEMGQFAAGRSELLLELQSIVEQFSVQGRGKLWLAATAQERLDEVVDNYAGRSDQVAKIRDRFPKGLRVELSQDDAEQVVRQRLLSKDSSERELLRTTLKQDENWILTELTLRGERLPYKPPALDDFVDTYPFLPAQFQLITEFMQGLSRDMGGTADRTARGSRALISVTQDLARGLKDESLGTLATIDLIYDEMQASIPPEDVDVIRDLERIAGAPAFARRVLKAAYVMEEIGDNLLANAQNLSRTLTTRIAGPTNAGEVSECLSLLTEKTFVREVGSSGSLTYRFLKAYQRKIEDDVRTQQVSIQERRKKAVDIVRTALRPLVPSTRVAFRGVRNFSIGIIVDNEFSPNDVDIKLNVFSPSTRHVPDDDARARSTTEHAVYWVPQDIPHFDGDVEVLVATEKVLAQRMARASTDEETSQLARATDDLRQREERLVGKLLNALKAGAIYVEGLEIPTTAQPADTILERLVETRFPGLWRAPVRVEEKDVDHVFLQLKPTSGPLVELGILVNGNFAATSEIAQDVLGAVKTLTFKGGATGERLLAALREAPFGYGDMQTRLAVAALAAMGLLRVHSPGGAPVSRDRELPQRIRNTNEFKRLTFELEQAVDPIEVKAVADLLEQRFDEKLPNEPPLIASAIRKHCIELSREIGELEGRLRDDVPQALKAVAALKIATKAVLDAAGDSATLHAAAEVSAILDGSKKVLGPLKTQLDADGIAAIVDSRRLLSSPVAFDLEPDEAEKLRKLLLGEQPWQDLKLIKQLRANIAARVRSELAALHEQVSELVLAAVARVRARAVELHAGESVQEGATQKITILRCPTFHALNDGTCEACHSDVEMMRTRVDAVPRREEEALSEILRAVKPPEPPGPKGKQKNRIVSLHASLRTPREIDSPEAVEAIVAEFRSSLEAALEEDGAITIVS